MTVGKVKGGKRHALLTLDTRSDASLQVAGHTLPLAEVLYLENNQFAINHDAIIGCVDHPGNTDSGKPYQASTTRREARKLDTLARHDMWRKKARELRKQHPDSTWANR